MAKEKGNSVVELIIALQSGLLMCFGLAAYSASNTIVACFRVLNDPNSFASFRTEDKVITETAEISTESAIRIVNNFELVCLVSISIGIIVMSASIYRIYKKYHGRRN